MNVELRHLRSFLVIAEELSFTRAAKRLNVSQPSLTRTVSTLEKMIGTQLLHRTTRSVSLTDEGTRLHAEIGPILEDLDGALCVAPAPLRLGFTWLLPEIWTQRVIDRFESDTKARVRLVRRDEALAGLDSGDSDVAVLRGGTSSSGRLRRITLFHERRVAAVRRGTPLAARKRLDWSEIADWPLVVNVVSGTTSPNDWPAARRPTESARCDNFDEWLEAVAADRGVGIVPVSAAYRVAHPAVRFVPIEGAPLVAVQLAYPPQGAHPLAETFVRAALTTEIPPHTTHPTVTHPTVKRPAATRS